MEDRIIPCAIAFVLACLATWWGVVALGVFTTLPLWSPVFVLGVVAGYLITGAYWWLFIGTPPAWVRMLLWVSSFIVQTSWLLSYLLFGELPLSPLHAWWLLASIGSLVALAFEPNRTVAA